MKPKVSFSSALLSDQCEAIIQILKEDTGYLATVPDRDQEGRVDPNAAVYHAGMRAAVNKLILAREMEQSLLKRKAEREADERSKNQ